MVSVGAYHGLFVFCLLLMGPGVKACKYSSVYSCPDVLFISGGGFHVPISEVQYCYRHHIKCDHLTLLRDEDCECSAHRSLT